MSLIIGFNFHCLFFFKPLLFYNWQLRKLKRKKRAEEIAELRKKIEECDERVRKDFENCLKDYNETEFVLKEQMNLIKI